MSIILRRTLVAMEYMHLKVGEHVEFIDKDGKPPIPHLITGPSLTSRIRGAGFIGFAKTVVLIWEDAK
jgi:hypothetical protein